MGEYAFERVGGEFDADGGEVRQRDGVLRRDGEGYSVVRRVPGDRDVGAGNGGVFAVVLRQVVGSLRDGGDEMRLRSREVDEFRGLR